MQDILIATPELPIYNPSLASSSAAYWLRCLIDLRMQDLLPLVSGFLGDTIAADAPLMEAGLDPIGAAHAEVRNAVASKFGVEVPATITFDYSSVCALAGFLLFVHSRMATPKASRLSFAVHALSSSQQYLQNRLGSMPYSLPHLELPSAYQTLQRHLQKSSLTVLARGVLESFASDFHRLTGVIKEWRGCRGAARKQAAHERPDIDYQLVAIACLPVRPSSFDQLLTSPVPI